MQDWERWTQPREDVIAELGVLQLGRENYVDAMDLLLHSGYWTDAAYVAERVLSIAELTDYLKAHKSDKALRARINDNFANEQPVWDQLNYLLARAIDPCQTIRRSTQPLSRENRAAVR